jgi:aminoglycoside phosphotransferase (APT) family kinase protein
MYSFILSYRCDDLVQNDNLLLRVYNKGFENSGFKEFVLLKALKERDLPVPRVYIYEDSNNELRKAFLIMERIDGTSALRFLNDEKTALIAVDEMAEVLSRIHKQDPHFLRSFNTMQKQYELEQERLLKAIVWIKKTPMFFFSSLPSIQKRFITAVKSLEKLEPKKFQPAILHNDYEPNHVLVSKGKYVIIDWHMSIIGDPCFEVANTYHVLNLLKQNSKINLGNYFVECYEKHNGQRLQNLQFCKTMSVMRLASWFLLFPFDPTIMSIFTNVSRYFFLTGRISYHLNKRDLERTLEFQHSVDERTVAYFQQYIVLYLENECTQNS